MRQLLKQQERGSLRQPILQAARKLFLELGYERFSMRRLAREIGYSPTTIYIYFRDKQALLLALCEEIAEFYLARLQLLQREEQHPVKRVRRAFLLCVQFGLERPDHYRVAFFTHPRVYGAPEDFMRQDTVARRTYCLLLNMVRECVVQGHFRPLDPVLATQSLWTAMYGVIAQALFTHDFPLAQPEVLAGSLLESLLGDYQTVAKQPEKPKDASDEKTQS